MNYYSHHIGDFNNATRHLTRVERSLYRDMVELYYDTERPLPLDIGLLCRKLVARTEEEKTAVVNLLPEFFIETPEGWRNDRCDEEIEKAREKMDEADGKRENERERQRRHRERRKDLFAQLRDFDEVPEWNTPVEQLQLRLNTHLSRVTNNRRTEDATANQYPLTNTQYPIEQTHVAPSAQAGEADQEDDERKEADAGKGKAASPHVEAVFTHWKTAMASPRSLLDTKRTGLIRGALKTGYTVEQLCLAIDGCAKSTYHMGQNDRGVKYNGLDLILRNAEKIDQFIVIGTSPRVPMRQVGTVTGRGATNGAMMHPNDSDYSGSNEAMARSLAKHSVSADGDLDF